jgi:hypothetical protein
MESVFLWAAMSAHAPAISEQAVVSPKSQNGRKIRVKSVTVV